jgi:general secretion pathway protein N
MLQSRRAFLRAGFYDGMSSAVNTAVIGILAKRERERAAHVADLGCGEGFFLARLSDGLKKEISPAPVCYGVDISRPGVRMATAYGGDSRWIVASLHRSPFLPRSLDVALAMFAPIDISDVDRIVCDAGALVTVTPGPDHLDALRAILYAEVQAHPLFNEDRQPTPTDASDGLDASVPQNPLNITLTGIVSTSSVKIAMVQDKARNQSIALKVGMPLEGDQASWTLVEVKPRSVVFKSAANERTEVELETSVAQPPKAPAPRTARTGTPPNKANGNSAKDNKKPDSGDLAKRIEDRRRQMREDAEKLHGQNGKAPPPPQKPEPPPKK